MKINPNNRLKTVDDIADDFVIIIGNWPPYKLEKALRHTSLYINDHYYDYELTAEEFEYIEEYVQEWFSEED